MPRNVPDRLIVDPPPPLEMDPVRALRYPLIVAPFLPASKNIDKEVLPAGTSAPAQILQHAASLETFEP